MDSGLCNGNIVCLHGDASPASVHEKKQGLPEVPGSKRWKNDDREGMGKDALPIGWLVEVCLTD